MRIQRVIARAFGPFHERALDLAPGMTVVAGPNESGKSSWHAAVRLAVTGLRRGKGPGTAAERQLAERHRPWDQPDRWEVEARLQLDDGRLIDISQDLAAKVACRAVDVALGRDVSDEILDGTPDAARWLGLDRDSFATTVAVNQSQIVAVADAAESLQEHMQRAAATRGTDATAAEAIARLEQFRKDAVGADTVAAKGPLRTAKNRAGAADAALTLAQRQHAEYLHDAAAVDAAERAALAARIQLEGAIAAQARMQAAEIAARAARAAALAARHAGPPPSLAADDQLAARVAAARDAWEERPAPLELTGRSAHDIQHDLDAVPAPPAGDVEPHPSVVAAQRTVAGLEQAIQLLGDAPRQPAASPAGLDAPRLRDLARRLEDRELPEAAALEAELSRLRGSQVAGSNVTVAVAIGLVVLAAGVVLVLASMPLAGATVGLAGLLLAAVLGFTGRRTGGAAGDAERALVPYREAAERARLDRERALEEALGLGLPQEPAALERLADEAAAAAQAAATHAAWQERRDALAAELDNGRRDLVSALADRNVDGLPQGDLPSAVEAYLAACRDNAAQLRAAERGDSLRGELTARRAAEEAAASAARREAGMLAGLRSIAGEIGIDDGLGPDEICAAIDAWRAERAGALTASQQALGEWQQLQSLLDGGTLQELQEEAARRRQRANELAEGLPSAVIALPIDSDPDEHLATLRRVAQSLDHDHDVARGTLDARRSTLPDVAEAEEAAATAQAELERVTRLAATIDATLGLLRAAQERVHRDLAPILADAVGRWLPDVSRGAYLEASVDPASLRVSVKEAATGRWRDARLLSEGTREQIYLLLRVAMAEHLVTTGERAPLLLDEVTAQADAERKRQLLDVMHRLSSERQVILFTHDEEVLAWAEAALREPEDAIVRLQPIRVGATARFDVAPETA
ncbi:MAG TPA: AAA family ATPase, partial [Candidatus Limnocylindria bacterium]